MESTLIKTPSVSQLLTFKLGDPLKQAQLDHAISHVLESAGISAPENIRDSYCIFDLSETLYYDLGALLCLISFLNKLKRQGNDIRLAFPESPQAGPWHFLTRWRFFKALSLCVDDPVNLLKPEQIPNLALESKYSYARDIDEFGSPTITHKDRLLEITTIRPKSQDEDSEMDDLGNFLKKFNDKVIISALSIRCGWDPAETKRFVQQVIVEGIQNSFLHSNGHFVNISMQVDEKNLILAIADNGLGIPKVLRTAYKSTDRRAELAARSDVELIKYFTEPDMIVDSRLILLSFRQGVSSIPNRNGMGLFYLKSLVLGHGGKLSIRSGKASVDFTSHPERLADESQASKDDLPESPGTILRIVTPLNR